MLPYQSLSITDQINFTLISFLAKAIAATEVQQWAKQVDNVPKNHKYDIEYLQTFADEDPENSSAHELLYDLEEMGIFFELEITKEVVLALEGITLERGYTPPNYSQKQQAEAKKSLSAQPEIKERFYQAFPFAKHQDHPYLTSSPYFTSPQAKGALRQQYETEANRFDFVQRCYQWGAITKQEIAKWVELEISDCEDIDMIEAYAALSSYSGERNEFSEALRSVRSKCDFSLTQEEKNALDGIASLRGGNNYEEGMARKYSPTKALSECPDLLDFYKEIFPFVTL